MTSTLLFLTPFFVLTIVALLGFVGCDWVLGVQDFIHPPTFNPPAGGYYAPQSVTLDDPDADEIHYNLIDPADPAGSAVSHKYDGQPILVSRSLTIQAVGSKSGLPDATSTAKYYVGPILYQQGPAETTGAGGTITQAFPNPLGQGNLVLVWVFYQTDSPAVQISAMTDGVNQYAPAAGPTTSPITPTFKQEIWYANNIAIAANAHISVSFQGGAPGEVQISAHEYSNSYQETDMLGPLADPPPAGTAGISNAPGDAVSSATVTTSGRLAFGAAWFEGTGAPRPPFVSRSIIRNNVVEDRDVTAPGDVAAVFVNTSAGGWMAQIVTLR
jgi:hypothetical protein